MALCMARRGPVPTAWVSFAEPEVGLILLLPNQPNCWQCPTLLGYIALLG